VCASVLLKYVDRTLRTLFILIFFSGGNAEIVSMWGSESGSYMQAVHFCFSLGGVIAPLIAQPFLAESRDTIIHRPVSNVADLTSSTTKPYDSSDIGCSDYNNSNVQPTQYEETNVKYAYIISAVMSFTTVVPFCCMFYLKRDDRIRMNEDIIKEKEPTNFSARPFVVKVAMLLLLSLLMFVYVGTEDTYAGYLMTFVTTELCWSKASGSLATSVFWICFGVTRLLCIPLIQYVNIETLMLLFSISLVISFAGLLLATMYNTYYLIWIFFGLPGVSMSIIFAAMFTWTNDNVVKVSGKFLSLMMTSASAGIMSFPILYGYTMDHLSPIWFVYLLLTQSIVWVVVYITFVLSAKCLLKKTKPTATEVSVDTHGSIVYDNNDEQLYKAVNRKSEITCL